MPFSNNPIEKRSDLSKPILSKEEWAQFTLRLWQMLQKTEREDESAISQVLKLIKDHLQRFDSDSIRLDLQEAKLVKQPAALIIEASPLTEAISGKTQIAYTGERNDLKERLFTLIVADHNLHCYSELHRQAGDIFFTAGKFSEALDHYKEVLRCRPRYSYGLPNQREGVETPPELQNYQWPQIGDRNTNRMYNIRLMPLSNVEAQILGLFYARLARCLSLCGQDKSIAEQAFHISQWFLERLGARKEMTVTIRFEISKFLLENGSIKDAVTEYENLVSILSQTTGSETALASALIDLGEAYLRAGKAQPGFERVQMALNIARRLDRQDLVMKAEKTLDRKQD
jgi:hypothetical protein